MVIPRIFHQIWLGPDPFPAERAAWQATWVRHNPRWELRFWTEETLPAAPRRPEAAQRLRAPWERAEAWRLEALWRFGGIYVETDVECLAPIEPAPHAFVALGGAVLGAAAGDPAIGRALDRLRLPDAYGAPGETTIPESLQQLDLAGVAVHHGQGAGNARDRLRTELAAVEAQVRQAQAKAFELRRRFERALRELDALRTAAR